MLVNRFLVAVMLISSVQVEAQVPGRWQTVLKDRNVQMSLDSTRVTHRVTAQQNYYEFWMRSKWTSPQKASNGKTFSISVEHRQLSCSPLRTRLLRFVNYTRGGEAVDSGNFTDTPGEWRDTVPDSIGEIGFANACKMLLAGRWDTTETGN